jgi:hypothetical protein
MMIAIAALGAAVPPVVFALVSSVRWHAVAV